MWSITDFIRKSQSFSYIISCLCILISSLEHIMLLSEIYDTSTCFVDFIRSESRWDYGSKYSGCSNYHIYEVSTYDTASVSCFFFTTVFLFRTAMNMLCLSRGSGSIRNSLSTLVGGGKAAYPLPSVDPTFGSTLACCCCCLVMSNVV